MSLPSEGSGRVLVLNAVDDGGRTEQLFAVGAHLRSDAGEQGWLDEGAGQVGTSAAGQHGCALVDCVLDLRVQVLSRPLGGQRPKGGRRVSAGSSGSNELKAAWRPATKSSYSSSHTMNRLAAVHA